jgi:hypothetical protein
MNKLITLNVSQDFYNHIANIAREDDRSVASYIRQAVKLHSKYIEPIQSKKDKRNPFMEDDGEIPPIDELNLD